jgi:hypothetical protein
MTCRAGDTVDELLPDRWPWRTGEETYLGASVPPVLSAAVPPRGHYTGVYGQICDPMAAMAPDGPQPKTETIPGQRLAPGTHTLTVPAGSAVSVLALGPTDLALAGDGGTRVVPLPVRRWRHLRFDRAYTGPLRVSAPVVLADPLPLRQDRRRDSPLVLVIFVDGLAQAVLSAHGEGELLPRVSRFFDGGLRFANCYATAEWTQTNIASVHTGQYASRHNMFHPRRPMVLGSAPILSERMRAAGYATLNVGGNWRATPGYGYSRGFDRTIYQKNMPGMQVVGDLIDQLTPLRDRDVFAVASFMDIHWKCEDVLPDASVQLAKSLDHQLREPIGTGPTPMYQGGYDLENIDAYLPQIRRLDRILGVLLDFLEHEYPQCTVLLFADHGQSFNSRFTHSWELSDLRLRVPLMVRGPGIPAGRPTELVELVDIPEILAAVTGIPPTTSVTDGALPACLGGTGRSFVYAETRYPGRLFRAAITEPERKFMLCSAGKVDDTGMFDLSPAHRLAYRLCSEEGKLDEIGWDDRYTDVILERAAAWMRR